MKTSKDETKYYGMEDMFKFAKENGITEEILTKLRENRPKLWNNYGKPTEPRPINIHDAPIVYSITD